MPRHYKKGGSEDQSSGPQTPSPIPDQSALEKLGTLSGADLFGYLLVGVVEVIEIFVGPPRLHPKWNPDLHRW